MARYKGGWVEKEKAQFFFTQFALIPKLNQRSACTDICSLSVTTAVSCGDPCYVRRERERERERERQSWISLPCQPHMVTRGQEGERGRRKDQFTKQQHTNSKVLSISVSVSLSVTVSVSLSHNPAPINQESSLNMLNILIKYIYLTLTTIFVGLFVCSQDCLFVARTTFGWLYWNRKDLLNDLAADKLSGRNDVSTCIHVYTYRSVRTEWGYSSIWLLAISLISSETTSTDLNERRKEEIYIAYSLFWGVIYHMLAGLVVVSELRQKGVSHYNLADKSRHAYYHWWELHQVSFLLQQKFCCNKHVFVMTKHTFVVTKHVFCHDKSMICLPRQNFCCDKIMSVTTKYLSQQHVFVMTKVLSRKAYFCCDKRHVLLRQTRVCHNKSKLVATKLLLWEKYVCLDRSFVVTSTLLLPQKSCLSRQNFCLNRVQVTLRAPLSDTFLQTLPELVMPPKGHSLSPCSWLLMLLVSSERSGY